MLEGERSYQRGQENLVPSNNASPAPESPVIPKAQENPWYIRHFIKLLIGFGLGGGAVAILLPWVLWLHCGMSSGSSDQLRLHLLYVTGGIIAVLTLLQTNWKNQGDRLKIDADIKKNEQDSEKNERDHIRQVHAERRSRYTKAVEQLADEKATVRLGGIYTLVGLVDEWLADGSLEQDEQQKEGQVIINNLCSYIRSPFLIAAKLEGYEARKELNTFEELETVFLPEEGSPRFQSLRKRFIDSNEYKEPEDITAGYAELREEQDVRRAIFVEMSKRSSIVTQVSQDKFSIIPGAWSDFDFDFSRAPIFYPLNDLTIEKANFSSGSFYGETSFFNTIFAQNADFSGATFVQNANFIGSIFIQNANFQEAFFAKKATFIEATFAQNANFREATFIQNATFWDTTFTQNANFREATFIQNADFGWATFTEATFTGASFIQNAGFGRTTFTQKATFIGASFIQTANFSEALFKNNSPEFVDTYEVSDMASRARFATPHKNRGRHKFTVRKDSKPIKLGTTTLLSKPFIIPIGTVLFDPGSWDEEKQDYTRVSEPAKPLDESKEAEENKPG